MPNESDARVSLHCNMAVTSFFKTAPFLPSTEQIASLSHWIPLFISYPYSVHAFLAFFFLWLLISTHEDKRSMFYWRFGVVGSEGRWNVKRGALMTKRPIYNFSSFWSYRKWGNPTIERTQSEDTDTEWDICTCGSKLGRSVGGTSGRDQLLWHRKVSISLCRHAVT